MRLGCTKVQIEDARQNGFVDVVFPLKDLCITQPPSRTLCPVATPGCACLLPGRRIHHLNMLERMVIAQILQRFHHQPYAPAQAGAALNSC